MNFDWNKYFHYAFSQQIIVSLVLVLVLCIVAMLISKKIDKLKPDDRPSMIVSICEMIASIINNFVKSTMGRKWKSYAPYIFTLAIYLTFANLSGLLGVTPPTSNWNITIALALITAFLIHYTGIKSKGGLKYIKETYFEPLPFLLPLNLIGEITFPLSLSLRLFGNIMSGAVISMMIYTLISNDILNLGAMVIVMPVFHMIFDIMFGMIQVVVFVLLSTIFISQKLSEEDLKEENENNGGIENELN